MKCDTFYTQYKKQLDAKEIEADAEELIEDNVPSSEAPAHFDLMKSVNTLWPLPESWPSQG